MNKLLKIIFLLVLLVSGLKISHVNALTNEYQPKFKWSGQSGDAFTFEQLGYSEKLMIGPFDSSSVYFSLPANIELAPASSIVLKYAVAWSGSGTVDLTNSVLGTLLVYFNDELIDTIILNGSSETSRDIIIPESAFESVDDIGRHHLRLLLNADVNCKFDDVQTSLIISKNSQFNLQYKTTVPTTDLALLPRPIFQADSIYPSSALIVVPDAPDALELQSALTVSAGLGSITRNELAVNLVSNSDLTPDLVASNHLIFVGLGKNFPNLQVADLPFSVGSAALDLPQANVNDGVIEIGLSPWSTSHVVLYIGGNSLESTVKAAQAFSSGNVVAVEKPNVSLISDVNAAIGEQATFENRTLKDLGYESQTMGLFGENYFTYIFNVSSEQASSVGGYFDLVISHSDLIDLESTGITVFLNDDIIGGVRLTEESPTTTRINLSPDSLRRGFNRLEIISDITPYFTCYSSDLFGTWVTISESSLIHLPVSGQKIDFGSEAKLSNYPQMFLTSLDLADLAVVLPQNDVVSWSSAAKALFYIGYRAELPIANLKVVYGDEVSEEILNDHNIFAFGRSSTLPFLSEINDLLPAPFENGSDEATQPSMFVNYSLLPDTSVGYLEVLSSPFNSERVIMAVLGNTELGIPMAGATLTQDELVSKLTGNFSIIYYDQIVSTDTRLGVSKQGIVSELPVAVTVTPSAAISDPLLLKDPQVVVEERPIWILPAIIITTVLMVMVLAIIMFKGILGKKSKEGSSADNKVDKTE